MAQASEELHKPRVEVVNEGTAEDARELWREAAFIQARRANKLHGKLKATREKVAALLHEIDAALHDDNTED